MDNIECATAKKCGKCQLFKPVSEFPVIFRYGSDRPYHICRDCKRSRDRARQKANAGSERSNERQRRYNNKVSTIKQQERLSNMIGKYCEIASWTCLHCGKSRIIHGAQRQPKSGCCNECKRYARKGKVNNIQTSTCQSCHRVHSGKRKVCLCDICKAKKKRVARLNDKHRTVLRRVRKYGAYAEPVNRSIVYSRDGYLCYICGRKVVRCSGYRPDMATMDHIVPLSKGGVHTYGNVRTCCASCNTKKGIGPPPNPL